MSIIHEEIKNTYTIIHQTIIQFYDKLTEEDRINFDSIRVYGTRENPLFNGASVIKCIVKTQIHHGRTYDELFDDEILEKQTLKGESHTANLITERGLLLADCEILSRRDFVLAYDPTGRTTLKPVVLSGKVAPLYVKRGGAVTIKARAAVAAKP